MHILTDNRFVVENILQSWHNKILINYEVINEIGRTIIEKLLLVYSEGTKLGSLLITLLRVRCWDRRRLNPQGFVL